MAAGGANPRKYDVPAGPILAAMRAWAARIPDDRVNEQDSLAGLSPRTVMAITIYPGMESGSALRRLHALERQQRMSFDLADMIITRLGIDWRSTPELEDVYMNADLATLDLTRPTCDVVFEQVREWVVDVYEQERSLVKTAAAVGVGVDTVQKYLRAEPVAA